LVGTWGVGVFDDDVAQDVRDGFRELIAAGLSPEEATQRLLAEYEFENGPSEIQAEWIALALTQWKTGRLLDWVRDRALAAIAQEPSERWEGETLWRRRERVLAKTEEVLRSAPPTPTRIVPRPIAQSPYAPGDVLRFTTSRGREVALWAMQNQTHRTLTAVSTDTEFQLVALGDPQLPTLEEIASAEPLVIADRAGFREVLQFTLIWPQHAQGPQWQVIGNVPFPPERIGFSFKLVIVRKGRGSESTGADAYFESIFSGASPLRSRSV
jgi:hypothetical protein